WTEKPIVSRPDVGQIVQALFTSDPSLDQDLEVTLFNLILPRSVVLRSGNATSLTGLGGFHGSVPIKIGDRTKVVYYSISVFSERDAEGRENGIAVFSPAWKNVVATLYHEINEFRTDPDVERANAAATEEEALGLIGWISAAGEEMGDHPLNG